MSRRGSILIRLVGVLVLVWVLFAVGALAFQAGQARGYALGLTVSGDEVSAPPAGVSGFGPVGMPVYSYWAWPHFGLFPAPFLGLLCIFGLGLTFLFALGAIFRPRRWHGYGMTGKPGDSNYADWHAAWHGWHGGPPPWAKETPPEPTSPAEESA